MEVGRGGLAGEMEGEKGQHLTTTLASFLLAERGVQFHRGRPFSFGMDVLSTGRPGRQAVVAQVFAVVGLR